MVRNKTERPDLATPAVMSFPQPPLKNAEEYLKAYTGYAYTGISAIAQEVASIKLHLFRAKYVKGVPATTEIYEHEVLSLLAYINPLTPFYDMAEATQIYLELTGEAFWVLLKEGHTPREAWLVRPDWMKIVPDLKEVISHYEYHPGGAYKSVSIPKENIIHFKYFHPLNPYRGKGSIQAAALPLDIHTFAQEYNRNFFFNSAIPSMVFSTERNLSEATVRRFVNQWQASYGGREKSNKVAFLGNGLKVDKISAGPKELDFTEQQKMMRDDVLAVFKVPKSILGLTEDVNRANAEATNLAFMERVITPRMKKFVNTLNEFLMPMYGDESLFLDFDDPAPEDTEKKLKRYENALKYGWMTPNEVRAEENMEPIEGGDELPKPRASPFGVSSSTYSEEEGPEQGEEVGGEEGKGLSGVFRRFFTKKEIKRIAVSKPVARKKPFKHMVSVPIKRLEMLERESLEKKLTPQIIEIIGQLLENKDINGVGFKGCRPRRRPRKDSSWTEEKKVAYWKQFIQHTDHWTAELRNIAVDNFKEQEHHILDVLDTTVKYWRVDFRKGKESSVIPSVEEMGRIWRIAWINAVREIYMEQANYTLDFLGTGMTVDITSEAAVEYIRNTSVGLVKDINQTTRQALRETLAEGFKQGEGVDKLKRRVEAVFHEAATTRAEIIARTEAIRASNAATVEAYRQSGVVMAKEWLAERDLRTCPFCAELDGKVIGLNASFFKQGDVYEVGGDKISIEVGVPEPPLHPNCRCTTIPILRS